MPTNFPNLSRLIINGEWDRVAKAADVAGVRPEVYDLIRATAAGKQSYADLAAERGVATGTIKSRVNRARNVIEGVLATYDVVAVPDAEPSQPSS